MVIELDMVTLLVSLAVGLALVGLGALIEYLVDALHRRH
jgi:hypothetical protein